MGLENSELNTCRKIVVLDGHTLNPGDLSWEGLKHLGPLTVYDRTADGQIVERAAGADAVFTNKTRLTAHTLARLPGLRYIGVLATGYNVVDVEAAARLGIAVTNIPTYGTAAVAQFTFALLLEACHHVGHHAAEVRRGRWTESPDFCFWDFPLVELMDKTMGIIGFGRIGQATARIAMALGINVLAYDSHQDKTLESPRCRYASSLDELLASSDVVSLHCPLTESTRGLINRETLGKCKRGAMLLNTSRGPLAVEEDVVEALDSGRLSCYAADVASIEPPPAATPLTRHPNAIITPHIAWASRESRERLMGIAVDNLKSFLAGSAKHMVN